MKAEQASNGLQPVAAAIAVEDEGGDNYNSDNMITNFMRWK